MSLAAAREASSSFHSAAGSLYYIAPEVVARLVRGTSDGDRGYGLEARAVAVAAVIPRPAGPPCDTCWHKRRRSGAP